jgi:hypothetical protein
VFKGGAFEAVVIKCRHYPEIGLAFAISAKRAPALRPTGRALTMALTPAARRRQFFRFAGFSKQLGRVNKPRPIDLPDSHCSSPGASPKAKLAAFKGEDPIVSTL